MQILRYELFYSSEDACNTADRQRYIYVAGVVSMMGLIRSSYDGRYDSLRVQCCTLSGWFFLFLSDSIEIISV